MVWGSLGVSYKNKRFLSHDADVLYGIIGIPEFGSLLEVLSTEALLYTPLFCQGLWEKDNYYLMVPPTEAG